MAGERVEAHSRLHVPHLNLVVVAARQEHAVVGAPRDKRERVGVADESVHVAVLRHVPYHNRLVLRRRRQLATVVREAHKPHFVRVLLENVLRLARNLVPFTAVVLKERDLVVRRVVVEAIQRLKFERLRHEPLQAALRHHNSGRNVRLQVRQKPKARLRASALPLCLCLEVIRTPTHHEPAQLVQPLRLLPQRREFGSEALECGRHFAALEQFEKLLLIHQKLRLWQVFFTVDVHRGKEGIHSLPVALHYPLTKFGHFGRLESVTALLLKRMCRRVVSQSVQRLHEQSHVLLLSLPILQLQRSLVTGRGGARVHAVRAIRVRLLRHTVVLRRHAGSTCMIKRHLACSAHARTLARRRGAGVLRRVSL
eukprot:Opistho-1_new@85838